MNDGHRAASRHIRLIATDLDGTLLRHDRTVSQRTQDTLARVAQSGITLALVTARPPRFVRALADTLGLTGVAICCNGAIIYDLARGEILLHTPIAAPDATAIALGLREAAPGVAFATESGLAFGCEPAYLGLGALSQSQDELLADVQTLCAQPVTKLIARHPERTAEEMFPAALTVAAGRAEVTYSSARFIEMSAPGVDKAWALAQLCQQLGLTSAEVVAFGDMPNDVAMLRWAGRGIAVANAHREVLAAATDVTASNMDDGVAQALERLLHL